MQIILPNILIIILIIIIIICLIYHFKNREGMEIKVTGASQPDVKSEIYDYNLRQALSIWGDIGCDEGSFMPTEANKSKWAHESWREELKAYKTEADKYNKEHNYYDYIGENVNGNTLKIGIRNAIGIGKAYNRCYDANFETSYTYPKPGDRVKIKKSNTDTSKYYSGIVLEGDGEKSEDLEVLWDSTGTGGSTLKDTKRTLTTNIPVQTDSIKIKEDVAEFGWPYEQWERHPGKDPTDFYRQVGATSWIKKDEKGKVDRKKVYKSTICSPDTKCDNLHCEKRQTEIKNRYPITYYCKSDPRNAKPKGKGWICTSGPNKGMITQYYDEETMCFKDEQGTTYGRKFAKEECVKGNSKVYNGIGVKFRKNLQSLFGGKCFALISDEAGSGGNRVIIGQDKQYTKADLTKLGLDGGKLMSTVLFGDENCHAQFDKQTEDTAVKKGLWHIAPANGATSIKLFKKEKGCEVSVFDSKGNKSDPFTDTIASKIGIMGGTNFNVDSLISRGGKNDDVASIIIKPVGDGQPLARCAAIVYTDNPTKIPFPHSSRVIEAGKGNKINVKLGGVSSLKVYRKLQQVIADGNYKIKSSRTGKTCKVFHELSFGNRTGKKFLQCNSNSGDEVFKIKQSGNDTYRFLISSVDNDECKSYVDWAGNSGVRCDSGVNGGEIFDITPVNNIKWQKKVDAMEKSGRTGFVDPGECVLKNVKTGKYCTNITDILWPGGGIMQCHSSFSRKPEHYTFIPA